MSDTPRTDSRDYELRNLADGEGYMFMSGFARILERELATLTAEVERKQAALEAIEMETRDGGQWDRREVNDAARRAVLPVGGEG